MKIRNALAFGVLPCLGLPAYLAAVAWLAPERRAALLAETGPIELGTAVGFLAAAGLAIHTAWRRCEIRVLYRLAYAVFAAAGLLVALEEISFGQHFIEMRIPEWFVQHNRQRELNFHNVGGFHSQNHGPANVLFPICCIAVPVCFLMRKQSFRPGSLSYYLVPKLELCPTIVVSFAALLFDRLPIGGEVLNTRIEELQELYWAAAAVMYIVVIRARLAGHSAEESASRPASATQLVYVPLAEDQAAAAASVHGASVATVCTKVTEAA